MTSNPPTLNVHQALDLIRKIDSVGGPGPAKAAEYARIKREVLQAAAQPGATDELGGQLGAVISLPLLTGLIAIATGLGFTLSVSSTVQDTVRQVLPVVLWGAGAAAVWHLFGAPGKKTGRERLRRPRMEKTVTYKDPITREYGGF